jgi:hypothetical protein
MGYNTLDQVAKLSRYLYLVLTMARKVRFPARLKVTNNRDWESSALTTAHPHDWIARSNSLVEYFAMVRWVPK